MRLINKFILAKVIRKNRGNQKLILAIQKLVLDIEMNHWNAPADLLSDRPDADCVYVGRFYFFDIYIHRTLILIEFDGEGEATIVWAGSHDDYELIFKNNRNTIKKWLRNNNWIK